MASDDGIGLVAFDLQDGQDFDDVLTITIDRQAALVALVTLTNAVKDNVDMMRNARQNGAPREVVALLENNAAIVQRAARAVMATTMPETFAEILMREEIEQRVEAEVKARTNPPAPEQ